jgi:tetratricopeptide (TPR) repeat protein
MTSSSIGTQQQHHAPATLRLNSWKEIASYLERDERTVKRWEKSRALPVRRLPGGRGRVFAFCSEIDKWQVSSSRLVESDPALSVAVLDLIEPSLDPPQPSEYEAQDAAIPPSIVSEPPPHHRAARWGFAAAACLAAGLALAGAMFLAQRHRNAVQASPAATAHTPPVEALNLYLSGRFYWNKRTAADLREALHDFQAAVAIDPSYAAAWAGIADCYGLSTEFSAMAPQVAYPRMLDAALRSVQLDPNLSEAHRALGFVLFYWNWDRDGARREFDRALQLNPTDATAYHWYGNMLMQSQQLPEALSMLDRARQLDPSSPAILADRGLTLMLLGRAPDAVAVWSSLEQSDPAYLPPHWYLAGMQLQHKNVPGYLAEMGNIAQYSKAPEDKDFFSTLEQAYQKRGAEGILDATAVAREQRAEQKQSGYLSAAWALYNANRPGDTLHFLELAYQHRDPAFPTVANPGAFPDLQQNPEFISLRARSLQPFPHTETVHATLASLNRGPLPAR